METNMSKIKDLVIELDTARGFDDIDSGKRSGVTAKLLEEDIFRLDYLADHLKKSRSGLAQLLMEEAIVEALEALGFDLAEIRILYMSKKFGKSVEECRAMLNQTGFKEVE
jgi:predicted transcriptional regulator